MSYQHVLVETQGQVGVVTLNRPDALNALSNGLLRDFVAALDSFANNDAIGAIVLTGELKTEAIKTAAKIAALSRPAVMMVKEAVNAAYETTLAEGLRLERRAFQSTFALEDRKEGMAAFAEKRKPVFRNR